MKLISCECCGVVMGTDRIPEPDVYDHDSGEVITEQAAYDNDFKEYKATITCTSCKVEIFHHNGNIA